MKNEGSWKSDLLHVGLLTGLCLLIGVHLIRQTVLISRDGVFYIGQAQQVAADWAGVARRCPAGHSLLLWAAHEAARRLVGHDSTMLWVYSSQSVTLACRVLALVPLYLLGKLLVGARHTFWALLILLVLPYPARYGSDVLREWPHLLFLSLGVWLLVWALRRRRWWGLALVGLVAGLGYTIRPECAQLVLYGFLGLVFVARHGSDPARATSDAGHTMVRAWSGAGLLLVVGFLVPVVPYVYATGAVVPPQLQPSTGNAAPVLSALGSQAACDDPLEFEVAPGELLELPIKAVDPDGDPLTFSLAGVPVGSRPVYEFRSPSLGTRFWTASELEKHSLLTTYGREVWRYEGIGFYAYAHPEARPGLLLVRLFWFPAHRRHFYTASEPEVRTIVEKCPEGSWKHEGVAFYAWGEGDHPPDTVPVWRFWSEENGYSWAVGDANRPDGRGTKDVPQGEGRSGVSPSDLPTVPPSSVASGPAAPAPLLFLDPETSTRAARIVWYVHMGGEPPAGAVIEGGIFRWRPGPGQEGEHQVNILVGDGDLQSCQLVRIRVVAGHGPSGQKGEKAETEEGEKVGRSEGEKACRPSDVLTFLPSPCGAAYAPPALSAHPQYAGLEKLPEAVKDLFGGVAEDLMVVFFVPWLLGLYHRLRYPVERLERILIFAVIIANVTLILSRHIGFEGGEDRRYSLALIALTIFYVPTGLEMLARWLGQWKSPALPSWPWFHVLVVIGLTVCAPKLLTPVRGDKAGYRAAAAWLRQNTHAQDLLAVPDDRLSFYAERQGLLYAQYPDSRRVDYVVMVGREGDVPIPRAWRREYSVPIDRRSKGTLVIYHTGRPKR